MGSRIQIAINPLENGVVYLWSDTSTSIWRLAPSTAGTLLTATALSLPAAPVALAASTSLIEDTCS